MLIVEKWEKIEKHCEENRKHLQLSNFVNIWVFTSSLLFNSDFFPLAVLREPLPVCLCYPQSGCGPNTPHMCALISSDLLHLV